MIYAALKKSPYGALIDSLLFWRYLSGALGSWGFDPNPYYSCVMNKTVDGKQCMIFWHIDGLKISQMNLKVVYRVLSQLTTNYRRVSSLSVSQGRVHDYIGMRLYYGTKGMVHITTPKHIESILEVSAEDMDGIYKTQQLIIFLY